MKFLKPIIFTVIFTFLLGSCKSISTIPVPKPSSYSVTAIAKKAPLTEEESKFWGHSDLVTDSIPGMSLDKAYDFLQGKKGVEVVVGVVDSGTDLLHEDLKDVAWVNPKEIPSNGIDDDKNGYVDDINGWNFLGTIYKEHLEYQRIVKDPSIADEETVKEATKFYDEKVAGAKANEQRYGQMLKMVSNADDALSKHFDKSDYSKDEVTKVVTEDTALKQNIEVAKQMYGFGLSSLAQAKQELSKLVENAHYIVKW